MPLKSELTGQKFGKLTAIKEHGKDWMGNILWQCKCECGKDVVVRSSSLRYGSVVSCGCAKIFNSYRHGKCNTAEYRCWVAMKVRCYNSNDKKYYLYGGRGIKVCGRWLNSFENFLTDMGYRPSPKHSLDRYPNMNGDYEKSNCRWATTREQNTNKRDNVFIDYNGQTKTIVEWSEQIGISKSAFSGRLAMGWSVDKIMATPIKK